MPMTDAETYVPESLDELSALLLAADGPGSPLMAGTRFLAQENGRAGPTAIIVEMGRVPELNRVEFDERNGLLIGAAVALAEPLRFPPVQRAYAILADSGGPVEPGRAADGWTIGECLSNAALCADLALPLICLGASVAVFGPHGWSEMSVESLCARPKGRALQPGEFIVDVRLPAAPARSGGACVRAGRAGASDDSVGVAALLLMQDDVETCCGARLAVRCDGAQPVRVPDAERFLQGRRLDDVSVEEAGRVVAQTAWLPHPASSVADVSPVLKVAACQAIRLALDRSRPRADTKRRVGGKRSVE
ncbi:MAG: dehydrogenase [candidate division NC10 bacterium]|nr:dehydrogenase [candidate division NC10 bacterium]